MNSEEGLIFHYPPELTQLLIQTIPLLCRSKQDVLLFFKGAGVELSLYEDIQTRVERNPKSIYKYNIVREIITRLNQKGENSLRERREILKRVTDYEDFSTCWEVDQLKAKGLVAEIRRVVNVKDTFTRMHLERQAEVQKRQDEQKTKIESDRLRKEKFVSIKKDLFALFSETNPQRRGKSLEGILNRLFEFGGILVQEAFTITGEDKEGIIEQIDGVIEIDGSLYFVEMKWWKDPLGVPEVSQHLVRVFTRGHARAILISSSGFTEPAIVTCKEALSQKVITLCKLEEIVMLLEKEKDLKEFFKEKIQVAIIHKNPMYEPLRM